MGKREDVVAYAKQFIGVPYLWGGTTPAGFDCSGLVQYVFKNSIGINLSRTTDTQVNDGTRISYSNIRLGDLVFTYGGGHVGIYVGNGQYINAPQENDCVRIMTIPAVFAVVDVIGEESGNKDNIPQYIQPSDDRVRDIIGYINVKTYVYSDKGSKYLATLEKGAPVKMYRVEEDWIHCYNTTGIAGSGNALYVLKSRVNIPVKLKPEILQGVNQYIMDWDERVRDVKGCLNVTTDVYLDKGQTRLTTLTMGTMLDMYRVEGDWVHCYNRTGLPGSQLYVLKNRINIPVKLQPEMLPDVPQYITEWDDRVRDIKGCINVATDVYLDKGQTRLTTLAMGTMVDMYRVEGDWVHCYNRTGLPGTQLYVLRNRINIPVKLQPELTPPTK